MCGGPAGRVDVDKFHSQPARYTDRERGRETQGGGGDNALAVS